MRRFLVLLCNITQLFFYCKRKLTRSLVLRKGFKVDSGKGLPVVQLCTRAECNPSLVCEICGEAWIDGYFILFFSLEMSFS